MNQFLSLRFINTILNLQFNWETETFVNRIVSFFSTHIDVLDTISNEEVATFNIQSYRSFDRVKHSHNKFHPQVIRKSSAKSFNLFGEKAVDGNLEIIDSENTRTAFILDSVTNYAEIFVSDTSDIQVIEFIRDVIIKHEETRGTLILHAAAAEKNGKATVIVGSKGAGKSTLLLDLVGRRGFNFISGDKVFMRLTENKVSITGWPEFPHLGYGTISGHPRLVEELVNAGYKVPPVNEDKILFSSEILQRSLGYKIVKDEITLANVIFPNVSLPTAETILHLLEDENERNLVLEHLEFSCNNDFSKYHNFINGADKEITELLTNNFHSFINTLMFYESQGSHPLTSEMAEVLE